MIKLRIFYYLRVNPEGGANVKVVHVAQSDPNCVDQNGNKVGKIENLAEEHHVCLRCLLRTLISDQRYQMFNREKSQKVVENVAFSG